MKSKHLFHFTSGRQLLKLCMCAAPLLTNACGGVNATRVSPDEIPSLESQLQSEPSNGQLLLRYGAALFAANRCDSATVVVQRGMAIRPGDALGPLVLGQCMEQRGDYDGAISTYATFANANPDARGTAAVRSREMLARRSQATANARAAIANEQNLAGQPTDTRTVAVLPLAIVGDSSYQPLSRGLAQMLTSDLALLEQFRMLERLQLTALLDEIEFSQGDRVDPNTAARVGRLMRAGRMVSGLAVIPDEDDVRLDASVVLSTGEVTSPASQTGRLRDLLQLEKQIVVDISSQLGYALSEAERQAILENGTQDLTAFLAYSNALVAEDAGDYGTAALFYQQAVQSDPGFQAARDGYQASAAAPEVSSASASDVTTVAAETVDEPDAPVDEPVASELRSGVGDMAPTRSEQTSQGTDRQTTQQAARTNASTPSDTPTNKGTNERVTGTIRIIFRLP